ncbi:hypothetical protein RT43_GL001381 [Enterococcus italicus DSM 15952]|nr:hypothetical protein RT43_GL001381 [Enterococcus italicus DSM 15952]
MATIRTIYKKSRKERTLFGFSVQLLIVHFSTMATKTKIVIVSSAIFANKR